MTLVEYQCKFCSCKFWLDDHSRDIVHSWDLDKMVCPFRGLEWHSGKDPVGGHYEEGVKETSRMAYGIVTLV